MIKKIAFLFVGWMGMASMLYAQDLARLEQHRVHLPNGWALTPAGTSLPLGDLPLNIAVSSTRRYAAVTNNGQSTQTIQLIDVQRDRQLDQVVIPKSWCGIAFSADEKYLYASGGNDNWILRYAIRNNKLTVTDTIKLGVPWPEGAVSPAGIALDDSRGLLYVVTKEDNSLYVVDLRSHRILHKLSLSGEGYTCLLSPDKSALYVSVWGGKKVMLYNTRTNVFSDSIAVGDHPNDLCLSGDGRYLYVSNANDNSVSVIDTRSRKVLETLNAALYPTRLSGSTSNGVALSDDGKTLYIANADNNCLAVFDVSRPGASVSRGFIPTGWYPTCVRVIGKKLYVANGKGFSSFPNPQGPNPTDKKEKVIAHEGDSAQPKAVQYIGGGLLMGSLSIIPLPTEKQLAVYSQAVYHNTPYNQKEESEASGAPGNPVPRRVGDPSPIKHVFYVIKENRTYDQVLGDMKEGNGDTSLVLFGERITPNQHAIARQFVLLDNFYVEGEVSADGHNWSMGAYATDFMEKNWPTSYGRRGKGASGPTALNKEYIWDQASRSGVSFRTYGEFASGKNVRIPVLKGHYVRHYPAFNLHIADTTRYRIWEKDFDSLVAAHALPQLMTVYFPNDHTEGVKAGRPTPFAHVADNDLAIGMFLEHISKSPVWKESVVFVLEDDAQNGPDHVDAHRSPAYIAGGYVKRHFVDHTLYSTSSIIRTIELILGMPPMTQYDAAATPMWRSFAAHVDTTDFNSLPANVDLKETSPGGTPLARMSADLDFSREDVIPDQIMNNITWKAVKGQDAVMPMPVRAAFVRPVKDTDDDDDD
ncbi:bifunctional YncE family protein/alkaline phosphatase family protein [Compostibacter hankyongensis]|uniref:Bifunctional YncE family protein/alkaline phosphatase family protein n=1 Tax=Compostibacter hankyongensis TaxID=1007089 RepID=A0ABP8G7P0_9BACT